jgi:hypothetical protein
MSATTPNKTSHRVLIILLRIVGVSACTAVIACVMPTTWIVATHRWLGLGEFPDAPITQYLARSISAIYAIFGGLAIVVSTDVWRYAPVINYLAYTTIAFGGLITGIDMAARLPTYWTLFEGPSTFVLGVVILLLARRVERSDSSTEQ